MYVLELKKISTIPKINKKHSENADTSTSVTFDLELWPWTYFKVGKAYIIRCRLLYCAMVLGMMSVNVIVCEIWPLIHFLWHLTFTCDFHLMSRSLSLQSLDVLYVVVHWYQVWPSSTISVIHLICWMMLSSWRDFDLYISLLKYVSCIYE